MADTETVAEGLRATLIRDHERLDQLFDALVQALRADARDDALRLWAAFDDGLCRHMALEERHLLRAFAIVDPREAAELLKEHDEIRAKLAELGIGVELHQIGVDVVSTFVEQLRQHARREDALAYRWAERLPPETKRQLQASLGAGKAARERIDELSRRVRGDVASPR
jgi:hemerythrin-like domain-containing protein